MRNLNCEIVQKKTQFSIIFYTPTPLGENEMPGYDVLEVLYQNCEIHGPSVTGSGPRVGLKWPGSKNILNL